MAVLAALLAWPSVAFADAISIKLTTAVPAGQAPKMTIVANQPVDAIEVVLTRDDGKLVQQSIASLATGATQELALDDAPGRHQYSGRITCGTGDKSLTSALSFETVVGGVMKVALDKSHVDLPHGRLELLVSVPAGTVSLKILSASDESVLVEREVSFSDHDASAPLWVTWDPPGKDAEIGRIDVRATEPGGAFQSYSLFPWTVYIAHEEVNFATDSSTIAPGEAPKLQASLAKISDALAKHKDLGDIKLYIAGHTDTVGSAKYNLGLSQKRAQAIAGWFRKSGLTLPIAYEGFGEQALRVATPDNTDEPRNRRVDYILAIEDPVLRATDFRPTWKALK